MVRRNNRFSRRRVKSSKNNLSLIKCAVLPMTVNYQFTASGLHDIHPATASSGDVIFRASSIDIFVASDSPQSFQILLFNEGRSVMSTETIVVYSTPRRIRLRAPKYLDYTTPVNTFWRLVLTGSGRVSGSATFTCKETLSVAV